MPRYAAKLLFQFRVDVNGDAGKRRTCEERVIHLDARSPRDALTRAKRHGRDEQFSYRNTDGNPVRFQFVGVLDLMAIRDGEIWYDIRERLLPMERRDEILPGDATLLERVGRV